jgi:hypothetical protein
MGGRFNYMKPPEPDFYSWEILRQYQWITQTESLSRSEAIPALSGAAVRSTCPRPAEIEKATQHRLQRITACASEGMRRSAGIAR